MVTTTYVTCPTCSGARGRCATCKTYCHHRWTPEGFTGKWQDCRTCDGTGEVETPPTDDEVNE